MEGRDALIQLKPLDAIRENLPVLRTIRQHKAIYFDYKAICYTKVKDYLEVYFSGTNSDAVAEEFTDNVFSTFESWNPVDIQAFINHIKKNKPESSGHKISPVELLDAAREYEAIRCDLFVEENRKQYAMPKTITYAPEVSAALKPLTDRIEAKTIKSTGAINEKDLNKFSETNKPVIPKSGERDFILGTALEVRRAKHEELKEMCERKEITEQEMVTRMRDFIQTQMQ